MTKFTTDLCQKTFSKFIMLRYTPSIPRTIYDKPSVNIILTSEKQSFSSNIKLKGTHSHHLYSTQCARSPHWSNQARKRNKRNMIRKEEVKLSLYIENPKYQTIKNVVKLQNLQLIYKCQWPLYTITMNYLKKKENNGIYNTIEDNEMLRNKLTLGSERSLL